MCMDLIRRHACTFRVPTVLDIDKLDMRRRLLLNPYIYTHTTIACKTPYVDPLPLLPSNPIAGDLLRSEHRPAATNMPSYSNPAAVVDSGSMSSVFTETESGWHVVKIERYSQTKGVLGVAACFKSTVFSAGGHRWRIGYYADGYADDTDDCIGFELFLVDHPDHDDAADDDVKAKFVFTLLDQAGQPVAAYTAASEVGTFSSAVPSWGFESFIERTELESKYLHDDDSFSVRCDVTVYKDSRLENLITATPPPPSRSCARVAVRLILWLILLVACRVVFGYIC